MAGQTQRRFHQNDFCFSPTAIAGIMATFACLSLVRSALTVFLISVVNRRAKNAGNSNQFSPHFVPSISAGSTSITSVADLQQFQHPRPPPGGKWRSLSELYRAMRNNDTSSTSRSPDKLTSRRCTTATSPMSRGIR